MNRYFSFNEFLKISKYLFEGDDKLTDPEVDNKSILKKAKDDAPSQKIHKDKDDKTGEEKMDKSLIPKDQQIKALAKELYFAQYDVLKIQDDVDKAIMAMTKVNAEDPQIAALTASTPVVIANATARVAAIDQQMNSIASGNPKLAELATKLSGESKNLAYKKALEEFGEKVKKYLEDAEKALKDKKKEKPSEDTKEEE